MSRSSEEATWRLYVGLMRKHGMSLFAKHDPKEMQIALYDEKLRKAGK